MYLSNLKLWNFRKYGSDSQIDLNQPCLDLDFTKGLNVLIGENDSGKTAIVDAIKLVLKTHSYEWIRTQDEDFYKSSDRFRIELRFDDLNLEEGKHFVEYLSHEKINGEVKTYLVLIYDVRRKEGRILPSDVLASCEDGISLSAEAREYLKVVYLRPLRDAENELIAKRNSRFSQILSGHEAFKGKEEEHYLVKLFEKGNKYIKRYFEGKSPFNRDLKDQKGKEIKKEIDSLLQRFCDPSKFAEIGVSREQLKSILEKLNLLIEKEMNLGLGTLNRLFMASELLNLKRNNWDGLRLGLVEEMEAHLHPQAQMKVIEALQGESAVQLILTTHSPNLASKVKLESLILCTGTQALPMGSKYTKLDPEDYVFLEKFLDVTKSNLFFASGVIFVEGWSEEILLPVIAKRIGLDLTSHGVAIVNVGNTAFARYSKIFQRTDDIPVGIPVSVIRDLDIEPDSEPSVLEAKKTKLKGLDGQSVKTFISHSKTLERCLFHSTSLSSQFQTEAKAVHSGTDFSDFESALKRTLVNNSFKKTEIAYRLASQIESLNLDISENDVHLKYLIDSIRHACGKDNN